MITAEEIFQEIELHLDKRQKLRVRYSCLYSLLRRICTERSEGFHTDFSGLFSQLYAVCQAAGIDYHAADSFRRRARMVLLEKEIATETTFLTDVSLLCRFLCELYAVDMPGTLMGKLQNTAQTATIKKTFIIRKQRIRAIVTEVRSNAFSCTCELGDSTVLVPHLKRTLQVLRKGMAVNLIDAEVIGDDMIKAGMIIIEPDYLIDVSALAACVKPYGDSPLNYFVNMFSPRQITLPILLGDAANRFMDDKVNASGQKSGDQLFVSSLQQHFQENMLAYACLSEAPDRVYAANLKATYNHVSKAVSEQFLSPEVDIDVDEVLLEPSFICECLGLRGRFDVMTADYLRLVELKSGKAQEHFGHAVRPKEEHVLQMSLYKEILHYNFNIPRDAVRSFLLYSRYPIFYNERSSSQAVRNILELRNEIVALEQCIREGQWQEVVPLMASEKLNLRQLSTPLWKKYFQPSIEAVMQPLRQMTPLLSAYFNHFLTFLEREKFLSKTTDNRPDSNRGFASVWTADLTTKLMAGDILINLRIIEESGLGGVEALTLGLPDYGDKFIANFSVGEMVQLYERREKNDSVTTRQLIRGYIEELTREYVKLRLTYRQRNRSFFSRETFYAIEHDSTDSLFNRSVSGLFSLLTATEKRRDLLLGQRLPEVHDGAVPLVGIYHEAVSPIVQAAKRAKDYFLLVGPPGTGKTSVALKAMVEEHLHDESQSVSRGCEIGESSGLLLMAYTNRAVGEICAMLAGVDAPYVRIGLPQTCESAFRRHLLPAFMEGVSKREDVRRRLLEVPIVVGTVATMSAHTEIFNLRHFVAIIDEASQVLEPQLLGLLCARHPDGSSGIVKFIMIGDHKQLPAVVLLPEGETRVTDPCLLDIGLTDLRNSLFERLHGQALSNGMDAVVGMLDRQGRMHPEICDFVNKQFYDNRLKTVGLSHQLSALSLEHAETLMEAFVASTRLGFVDVASAVTSDNNKINKEEAEAVAAIIGALLALLKKNNIPVVPARQIGIIVPFRNQIATIRSALLRHGLLECEAVTIDTVECFQGSQRDYVIFSTTIRQPYQLNILSSVQQVGGTDVDRKLNVALTRARKQFFMVGCKELLCRSSIYRSFITTVRNFTSEQA